MRLAKFGTAVESCSKKLRCVVCSLTIRLLVASLLRSGENISWNFLISCFSVPFHVAAIIQFSCEPDSVSPLLFLAAITASNYFPGLQSVNRLICRLHILP